MLWVSADPGCGKSVLAKHLVDFVLPSNSSRTTCYFFFKDDFEDQRSVRGALCCILHQLFTQKGILFSDRILNQFESDRENLTTSFSELWDILIAAAEDKHAGEIICIFDALDECDGQERLRFEKALTDLYGTKTSSSKLKILITSRPYSEIRRGLPAPDIQGLSVIHLSGESDKEREMISQEIGLFIKYRIQNIKQQLTQSERGLLLQAILSIPHRTYLWVYLTLDQVDREIGSSINEARISEITSRVPKTVDEAYNNILSKSRDVVETKRLLHIVVAATRPLTLKEMQVALALREHHNSYTTLSRHIGPEERFREFVRDLCGLFVMIVDGKIYLLHQTAKEFLVSKPQVSVDTNFPGNLKWKDSLQPQESHRVLAEICVRHLLFSEFETHPLDKHNDPVEYAKHHDFLDYSAKNWAIHLRHSQMNLDPVFESILRICDVGSNCGSTWFKIYWTTTDMDFPSGFTSLMIASYFGLTEVVRRLLWMDGVDVNSGDVTYGRSALSWAAENGFDEVVAILIKGRGSKKVNRTVPRLFRQLLNLAAVVDSVDKFGRTPLSYAAWNGHAEVVRLLLQKGKAHVNKKDDLDATPLYYAICWDHQDVIDLLEGDTENSAAIKAKVLLSAAEKGHKSVVERLIASDLVDINAKNQFRHTPLSLAAQNGHEGIVKMLLATGKVDVNSVDRFHPSPLHLATQNGHEDIVKMLLATGKVDVNSVDSFNLPPLSLAAQNGHEGIVKMLLDTGQVEVNSVSIFCNLPSSLATGKGHESFVKMPLAIGGKVNISLKSDLEWKQTQTPLSLAAENGHEDVVKVLLATGEADINSLNDLRQTPLSLAAQNGHEGVVKVLLATGEADVNFSSDFGQTPLSLAAKNGHEGVVRMLVASRMADIDREDRYGNTALFYAKSRGDKKIIKLLTLAQFALPPLHR